MKSLHLTIEPSELTEEILELYLKKRGVSERSQEQLMSAVIKVRQYEEFPEFTTSGIGSDTYLGMKFSNIFIGVEKNGYAHS